MAQSLDGKLRVVSSSDQGTKVQFTTIVSFLEMTRRKVTQ